ncbi:Serine/threonine-protein kinase PksC [Durusdinium trenchii]|uniref:non-specific serine/threonine protein kinase n=1 Tax=Durusdinium trenchii TaxID=1381693 RepID=A0ABP0SG50_9DINO
MFAQEDAGRFKLAADCTWTIGAEDETAAHMTGRPSQSQIGRIDFSGQALSNGRYKVQDRLGAGSMGYVYKAFDKNLQTEVVLKIPTLARLEQPEFLSRFRQESKFLVRLSHPHIVSILDVGEHDGVPFFVMQFVGGGSLEDRQFDRNGRKQALSLDSLKTWLTGVASALDFMHAQGCIHRDVKPGNILFDQHGNAYLSDFGLSKVILASEEDSSSMTAAGAVVGTPNYVAPEIVLGKPYDGRADQYSLATTVYELLTGRIPLEGPTASATMVNQTTKRPANPSEVNPEITPVLAKVILRGLSKQAENRYRTCAEFAEEVIRAASSGTENKSGSSQSWIRGGSTAVSPRPKYVVAAVSKGQAGRVPCPGCGKELVLRPAHAGKRGKCVQCGGRIAISRDLTELQLLEQANSATSQIHNPSRSELSDDFDMVLGQELFGYRLTKRQSIWLAVGMFVLTVGGIALATGWSLSNEFIRDKRDVGFAKISQEGRAERSEGSAKPAPATVPIVEVVVDQDLAPWINNIIPTASWMMPDGSVAVHKAVATGNELYDTLEKNCEAGEEACLWLAASRDQRLTFRNELPLLRTGQGTPVARSPIVCLMWRSRWDALRQQESRLNIPQLARNMDEVGGWSVLSSNANHVKWGTFKVGIPHPNSGPVGTAVLVSIAQGILGKAAHEITGADLVNESFRTELRQFLTEARIPRGGTEANEERLFEYLMQRGEDFADVVLVSEEWALRHLKELQSARGPARILPLQGAGTIERTLYHVSASATPGSPEGDGVAQMKELLLSEAAQRALLKQGWRPVAGDIPLQEPDSRFNSVMLPAISEEALNAQPPSDNVVEALLRVAQELLEN